MQQEILKPNAVGKNASKDIFFLSDCSSGEISVNVLEKEIKHFSGGKLRKFYQKWLTLTNVKFILDIIFEDVI